MKRLLIPRHVLIRFIILFDPSLPLLLAQTSWAHIPPSYSAPRFQGYTSEVLYEVC